MSAVSLQRVRAGVGRGIGALRALASRATTSKLDSFTKHAGPIAALTINPVTVGTAALFMKPNLIWGPIQQLRDAIAVGALLPRGQLELQSYMNYLMHDNWTAMGVGAAVMINAVLLGGSLILLARAPSSRKTADAPAENTEVFPGSHDTEIDLEPPRTMSFRLPPDFARFHPITPAEFTEVEKVAQGYSILRKIVESPLMKPRSVARIGSYEYCMSRLLTDEAGKRLIMIGLTRVTEDDGRPGLRSTLFYKSQSGGSWRTTTHITWSNNYSKGKYHYTQETQPTRGMLEYLQSREFEEPDEIPYTELTDAFHVYNHGRKTEIFVAGAAGAHDMVLGSGQLAQVQRIEPGKMFTLGHVLQDYLRAASSIPKMFTPDYRRGPVDSYAYSHSLLGECMIYEYEAEFEGRKIIWGIGERSNFPDERRYRQSAWVEYIRYADAQDTPHGTHLEVIHSGMITNKPLEYTEQATEFWSGDPELVALRGEQMGSRLEYVDIRRFIGRMPFMEGFYDNPPPYK